MTVINIKFRNTNLSLNSDDEDRLRKLVTSLNKRADETANNFPNISDTKLAIISAIMLEDRLDTLNEKFNKQYDSQEEEGKQAGHEFIDTVSYLADYIEHLADQIEKRYSNSKQA
jgi:cell division protein ZapA (FtsZ GTPase activity inhibitor)